MATSLAAGRRLGAERIFFTGMGTALLAAVLLGFARSFYLSPLFPDRPRPAEPFFILHGIAFTAWFVLIAAQPMLIASGGYRLHRRIGWAGAALALLMVPLGVHGGVVAASRPTGFVGVPIPPDQFLITPVLSIVLFVGFIGLAVSKRHDAPAHKRLMMLGSAALVGAAFARWPVPVEIAAGPFFLLPPLLFPAALMWWDVRTRGRVHPATAWGGAVLVLSVPVKMFLGASAAWLSLAHWMMANL